MEVITVVNSFTAMDIGTVVNVLAAVNSIAVVTWILLLFLSTSTLLCWLL
jgi:hypothetical protein